MHTTKKEKEQQIENALLSEVRDFYNQADPLACLDAITYSLLSIDEEITPLTSMDNVQLRSLTKLLVALTRLKYTGSPYA